MPTATLRWVIDPDSILTLENDSLPSHKFSTTDPNFNWHLELSKSKSGDSVDIVRVWLHCDPKLDPMSYSQVEVTAKKTSLYSKNWSFEAPKHQFRITSVEHTESHELISFSLRNINQSSKDEVTIECELRFIVKDLTDHSSDSSVESNQCSDHDVLLVTRFLLRFDTISTADNTPENQSNRIREAFENVLDDIYAGKTSNLEKSAFKVFPVAYKYDLTELKNVCEQVLLEKLSTRNVDRVLDIADQYDSEKLKVRALQFISEISAQGLPPPSTLL